MLRVCGGRGWPDGPKARTVAGTPETGAAVSGVARRRRVRADQLTCRRRPARDGPPVPPTADGDAGLSADGPCGGSRAHVPGAWKRLCGQGCGPARRRDGGGAPRGDRFRSGRIRVGLPSNRMRIVVAKEPSDLGRRHDGLIAPAGGVLRGDPLPGRSSPSGQNRSKVEDRLPERDRSAEVPPSREAPPYRPPSGRPTTLPRRRPRRDGRQPCRDSRSAGPPCPYGRPSGTGSGPTLRSRPPAMPPRPIIPMIAPTNCALGTSPARKAETRVRRSNHLPRAGEGTGAADAGG